ncbi:MAG: type-F conjugative transfer system protein TraW [Burkholderiales bacterium]|nr:type-F conjugative transfer system protein TraW [Burkholderiales bacterium]
MKRCVLIASLACLAAPSALAVNLGTIGPTYGIAEPHLLADIERRLREKERTGELQRLIDEARSRGVESVRQPAPVPGLRATEAARTFYVDPSFTLDRNVVDAQGRLLFAAGTRKNPLEVVSLTRKLLFFDARDAKQVRRAGELMASTAANTPVKPILTGGSYLDLMRAWRVPVYYDQQGALSRRLGIQQVPALVSQEGARLRIDELSLR